MRSLLSRPSLLARFSVISLLVMGALGFGLSQFMEQVVERRALENAVRLAEAIAATGVQKHVDEHALDRGLDGAQLSTMERAMADEPLSELGVSKVKIFTRSGTLVYSDDRSRIGEDASGVPGVRSALMGMTSSKLEHGTDHSGHGSAVLEVYLPLMHDKQVFGVFELYMSYEEAAQGVADDKRLLYGGLLGGLVAVWLTLFRVVSQASRRLRRQADESHRQARHDYLTGLLNRRGMQESAEGVMRRLRDDQRAALLLIDLDHFKEVNDTLGHDHGDRLLEQVADRLRSLSQPGELLARLGGDEFACLLVDVPDAATAQKRAQAIRERLADPVDVGPLSVRVDASIGIAISPDHGDRVDTLLKHADVAMYRAKDTPDPVQLYSAEQDPYTEARLVLATELREAVERDQLVVHYQPIVDATGSKLRSVEALVRWQHPEHGLLPPGAFLPLAERTGVIGPLTRFVIEQVVRDGYRWEQQGLDIEVACNLASASASDSTLPGIVAAALERWPLSPHRLVLELSEDTVITDPRRVEDVLHRLSSLGVRLALDDFGTGQSSLSHLRRLPLNQLKIDRSFVAALQDGGNTSVVEAMLGLAGSYGLETVAEGVEDREVAHSLRDLGCHLLQGYHFSRPLPADELEQKWLTPQNAALEDLVLPPHPSAGTRVHG